MWNPIKTAPKDRTLVFIIFEGGDIALAKNTGRVTSIHNDWWTMDGLDFGYGADNPIGWLPREALPPAPVYADKE